MTASRTLFATFDVSRQGEEDQESDQLTAVFHRSALSAAIVNLKPLLPGHVLIIPRRVVARLADLQADEVSDLFRSVQAVGRAVERAYKGEALTISLQDGASAGQSVPHIHVHVIPRRSTDFGGENDKIYPLIEAAEERLGEQFESQRCRTAHETALPTRGKAAWNIPSDHERTSRSIDEMEAEARWLQSFF